jgi:diguanylate cyclase (GGDEF)-like protein/PAS domain S-box-containing protein
MQESNKIFNDNFAVRLFELSPYPALLIDGERFVECNRAALQILGYDDRVSLLNTHPSDISPMTQPDGESSWCKANRMIAIAQEKGTHRFEWVHKKADGSTFVAEVTLSAIVLDAKQLIYCVWRDITEQAKANEALARSEMKLRILYASTRDAVMLLDEKGFFDCNKATLDIFDCPSYETFYALHPSDLSPETQACGTNSLVLANQYIQTAMKRGSHHFEWLHKRATTGQVFPADVLLSAMELDGKRVVQAVVRDITERKRTEETIRQMAFYDTLTNLPNRRMLEDRLQQAITLAGDSSGLLSLLFIDLDKFKQINDDMGHEVGDWLLQQSAERMKLCVRNSDTVARIGGDEFVVLLPNIFVVEDAVNIAEKIRLEMEQPFVCCEDQPLSISASIGVVIYPEHANNIRDLLRHGDMSMYHAKKGGRNAIRVFSFSS